MPYAILVSYGGRATEREWEPVEGLIFETGREAGDYAKSENAFNAGQGSFARRFKAIKITEDNPLLWRQRIENQIADGTLKRVPWHDYYYNRSFGPTGMYEHIDPDDGTKVRFIANHVDGMQGRFTSMTPGRFIKRHVDDCVDGAMLDTWCAQMGLELTTSPLMLAKTPEEVVYVYNNGPHSCMAYEADHPTFGRVDQHPCAAYGNSDLAVAYILRRGEITARCMVWPEQKKYGRIYGDRSRLVERLKENDYIECWDMAGAKIRQLRTKDGQIILPYIDGNLGVVPEGEDWLILTDKPHIIGKSPYGIPSTTNCYRCGRGNVALEEYFDDEDDDEPQYICAEGC